ncbi:MAG: hypothetical protein ACXAEU_08145 [Candidatus Hodarchaeales archaeon]
MASQEWFTNRVLNKKDDKFRDAVHKVSSNKIGEIILVVLMRIIPGIGIFIGLGLAFLNTDTAVSIGAIPIVIIISYVVLVFQSEILLTIEFVKDMNKIDNDNMGSKDLKFLVRSSYILKTRKNQFLIMAALLLIYGIFGGIIDTLAIYTVAIIEYFYLGIFASMANLLTNQNTGILIGLLFIVASLTSVVIAIALVYVYVKFCLFLIRIEVPEDLQHANASHLVKIPVDREFIGNCRVAFISTRKESHVIEE